jgi:hypothetical protein
VIASIFLTSASFSFAAPTSSATSDCFRKENGTVVPAVVALFLPIAMLAVWRWALVPGSWSTGRASRSLKRVDVLDDED